MAAATIAILEVQLAQGGSDRQPLRAQTVSFGRDGDTDIILDDPQVSGHHARISFAGSGATLMDLGSLNGTWINGQRLPPRTLVALQPGQVFQIDEFSFRLSPPEAGFLAEDGERFRLTAAPRPGLVAYVEGKLRKFPFHKQLMTLGRAEDNDIVLPSNLVSRQHAAIRRQGNSFVIVDAGGRNGLTFNGQRVPQHTFSEGDVIYIGGPSVALQFRNNVGFVSVAAEVAKPKPLAIDLKGRERVTIGRARDNDITLDHPAVSRHHALIERMGTRYRIRDLKSSNGVFLDGKRVQREAWLKEGAELRIGDVRLILSEDGIQQFSGEGLRLDVMRLHKWVCKDKNLLQDISLSIYPQEFVALVGMSGSGKSTLMDAINGFRPATHGAVSVNGVDLYRNFDLFRNDMGYVPQKDIVHQELTVYSALDYAAQLRMPTDTSSQERHKRIMAVLSDLDLAERKELLISKLSGGQLKRVSIGVELLTKPRLFFLDEPTSGLDPGTELEMMKLLRKLADQGRTIMLITHATKNVMMCDKVIFLARGGYMAYYGPPEEALPYFDQYRTPEERQQKDIEFDDIYMILGDEKRGKGKDWGDRYRQSRQHQEFVVERLGAARQSGQAEMPTRASSSRWAGVMRQFFILSARNLKIMAQDKFGLALMLALAPMIGMMDFIWGKQLFDLEKGDAPKIITMLFMTGLISILVGAMASVREIVKEVDIYKRERAINLKLPSYILSKIWVGFTLSIYQAVVLFAFQYFFNLRYSGLGPSQCLVALITIFMGTLSGYLFGLLISAAAPNQNVALLLVIAVLVPQFLFAGALLPLDLIPGGKLISVVASTRWAFEALLNNAGIGSDIMADPCWQYVIRENKQPSDLSQGQKEKAGCPCMGVSMFDTCHFPGIRNPEFYTAGARAALSAPRPQEPPKPTALPSPTPYPTFTPYPTLTPYPSPTPLPMLQASSGGVFAKPPSQAEMEDYQRRSREQGEEYRKLLEAQGQEYADMRQAQDDQYQALREEQSDEYAIAMREQGDEYSDAMRRYGDEREAWQRNREKAISAAEGNIKMIVGSYGSAFSGTVFERWFAMSVIMLVLFIMVIAFQKRKDVV
ncbi:MAG: FHA domain-containing protein [Anaerolineae bacterium]